MDNSTIPKNIPDELRTLRQWLIWRYVQKPGKPKPDKVPYTTMGYRADVTNPEHWSTFEFALKVASRPGFSDGIGFVFAETDPFTGIDLDNVWQSDADEGAPWALRILWRFSDTYSEESPSGRGAKIWCRAKPPRSGSWPAESGAVEIYGHGRFFTMTGKSNGVLTITDHQTDIEALIGNLDGDHPGRQAALIDGTIKYGTQHNTLVSLAGTMHRRGMSLEAIEAALLVVNRTQCERPGPEENIRKIVGSMAKWRR